MKANTEILDKIKKMLKLAMCQGAQPGEVENAMAKAKELAMRFQLDIGSVDLNGGGKSASAMGVETDTSLKTKSYYMQPYHRTVFWVLEEVFGVEIVYNYTTLSGGRRLNKITVIGETTNVAIAIAMWPYLEKVFPASLSKQVSAGALTYCAAHTNGWYAGLAHGIIKANKREEEKLSADDKNKWAMVLVKKEDLVKAKKKELFPDLKDSKSRRREMNQTAIWMGSKVGEKINLRQVNQGTPSRQIS